MASTSMRAPKQWCLTKQETITSFETWKQNLQFLLAQDPNFACFLADGATWLRKTAAQPLRGLHDDDHSIPDNLRRTAQQKVNHLDLMLGQIANYCPIISRNTIIKYSTSMTSIWQAIRLHFGFQATGSHFLDYAQIHLEVEERPEDLFQRLMAFIDDSLLKTDGGISHHTEVPAVDEELSPTLENVVVLQWLHLIHRDLPRLVKQRYGTELRTRTLASIKPEISLALDSLLEELRTTEEAKIMRSGAPQSTPVRGFSSSSSSDRQRTAPSRVSRICPLCKLANRPHGHFLSKCQFLPEADRRYLARARVIAVLDDIDLGDASIPESKEVESWQPCTSTAGESSQSTRRVNIKQSPYMYAYYRHHPLKIILDTGSETNMVRASTAHYMGATVSKSSQIALQADGHTPMNVTGEVKLTLERGRHSFFLEALVVEDLDVDVLAGVPFLVCNDISIHPAKHEISLKDDLRIAYGLSASHQEVHSVRRTATVRAPPATTVVWPGESIELEVPWELSEDISIAVEPRSDSKLMTSNDTTCMWPTPTITHTVAGHLRLVNDTDDPQLLRRNDHFCQILPVTSPADPGPAASHFTSAPRSNSQVQKYHSDSICLDPDSQFSPAMRNKFQDLHREFDAVFDPVIVGYNGACGPLEAVVNMGPVQPPQRKGRLPQYSRDKLLELQSKFDELESVGVFLRPEDAGVTVEYLNPSFLVKKANGGYRLVTAFSDVGRYSKPQPSLMPDVESTLRTIGRWRYIIVSDMTSAFYQIPVSKSSMKYCGVATPFKGIRLYARCAMGMPGSETALEELMCRVLGDLHQEGIVAKLADDLYCGGDTEDELLHNWRRVLSALDKCSLRLSTKKTIVNPKSTGILGWIWTQGTLKASPHRIAVLSACTLHHPVNCSDMRFDRQQAMCPSISEIVQRRILKQSSCVHVLVYRQSLPGRHSSSRRKCQCALGLQ